MTVFIRLGNGQILAVSRAGGPKGALTRNDALWLGPIAAT